MGLEGSAQTDSTLKINGEFRADDVNVSGILAKYVKIEKKKKKKNCFQNCNLIGFKIRWP